MNEIVYKGKEYNGPKISNCSVVDTDSAHFIKEVEGTQADVWLNKGKRVVMGEGQYHVVANGLPVVCASTEAEFLSRVTKEDLYSEIPNWTFSFSTWYKTDNAWRVGSISDHPDVSPQYKNYPCSLKIRSRDFLEGITTYVIIGSVGKNINIAWKQNNLDTFVLHYTQYTGIAFWGISLSEDESVYRGKGIEVMPVLVGIDGNNKEVLIPTHIGFWINQSSIEYTNLSVHPPKKDLQFQRAFLRMSDDEWDFAAGVLNEYEYITPERYEELLNG